MNYFERLVRRAKLREASEPGMPLADPFENEDVWPLDPVLTAAMAQRALGATVEPIAERRESSAALAQTIAVNVVKANDGAIKPPLSTALPPTSSETFVETKDAPATTPPVPHPSEPAAAVTIAPTAPLELADRFLRELGVRVADEAPLAPPMVLASPPSVEAAATSAVERATSIAQVLAPSAPIVEVQAARETEQTDVPAPPPRAPATNDGRASRSPAAATETRRVVVVERSSARGGDSVAGGGAPHFGLGQL